MHLTLLDWPRQGSGDPLRTSGCFPLCVVCWESMLPQQRLPYYRDHWLARNPGPQDLQDWFVYEAAVLGESPGDAAVIRQVWL
jgi:hypothetical protein